MTLTIVNHSHALDSPNGRTFIVVGELNGGVEVLKDAPHNFRLKFHDPRTHAKSYPEPDGSQAELYSSASDSTSTPFVLKESKSGESSVIFGRREE